MDDWLKWGIPIAAGIGLLATGGAAAPALAPLLGAEAAAGGAAAAGAATTATGAGTTAVGGLASLGGATAANVAPAATGAMSYVTAPLLGGAESATAGMASLDAIAASQPGYAATGSALEGLAAANPGYAAGGDAALNTLASDQAMGGFGGYLKDASKAASIYNTATGVGAPQQGMQAPAPQSIFDGKAAPIAQQQQEPTRGGNEFARMLLEQRKRGMLG